MALAPSLVGFSRPDSYPESPTSKHCHPPRLRHRLVPLLKKTPPKPLRPHQRRIWIGRSWYRHRAIWAIINCVLLFGRASLSSPTRGYGFFSSFPSLFPQTPRTNPLGIGQIARSSQSLRSHPEWRLPSSSISTTSARIPFLHLGLYTEYIVSWSPRGRRQFFDLVGV